MQELNKYIHHQQFFFLHVFSKDVYLLFFGEIVFAFLE